MMKNTNPKERSTSYFVLSAPPLIGIYRFMPDGLKLVRLLNGAKSMPKGKEK
ncbi:MAG: hypothetical protein WC009_07925 [Methylotenera sp.]